MTQEEKIAAYVDECIDRYRDQCGILFGMLASVPSSREHIVRIGTSILCTKWGVGFPGGSFVQAVVGNDLMEAFGRADSINVDCIRFYTVLLYNARYIE